MKPDSYKIKEQIGIVLQNVAVFEELTVQENIDYFCGLYIRDKKRRKELVEEAIEFTGLEDFRKMHPRKLSGGLLRRLNIACGIAHKPRLIIMDEPTVAVDPQSRNKILEGIQTLNRQAPPLSTLPHYMEEVEQICTRIAHHGSRKSDRAGNKRGTEADDQNRRDHHSGSHCPRKKKNLQDIRTLDHVFDVQYEKQVLVVRCTDARHNLIRLLNYLQSQDISFGRVFSELPTLNDVFLEITGKQLRD